MVNCPLLHVNAADPTVPVLSNGGNTSVATRSPVNVIFAGNRIFLSGETDYNDTTRGVYFNSTSSMSSVVSRTLKTGNFNYIPVRRRY